MRLTIIVTVLFCCLLPVATRAELPLDDLALYMSFDDIQGNKVMDGSEHGNDGTIMKASVAKGKGNTATQWNLKAGIIMSSSRIQIHSRLPMKSRFPLG